MGYLLAQVGFHLLAYLDDFTGCYSDQSEALKACYHFLAPTTSLGLTLANDKSVPPTQNIKWLGYNMDTRALLVFIPPEKMQAVI